MTRAAPTHQPPNPDQGAAMTTTTERIAALRREADQLEATNCTGLTAIWCPVHGDCTCGDINDDPDQGRTLNDYGCPLHGPASSHAEEPR